MTSHVTSLLLSQDRKDMEGRKIYDGVRKGRALRCSDVNIYLNIVTRYFFGKNPRNNETANESRLMRSFHETPRKKCHAGNRCKSPECVKLVPLES